ncbi:MAG: hypothetical protein O7G85_11810 [Planctomycetota bacterium]|nr:hypothetical protein [Planctomycetota bacterium]
MNAQTHQSDAFPRTTRTWIGDQLALGAIGRDEVNRHVMAIYSHPLRVYLLGSSCRTAGEPDEIINGFFASRLDRSSFFDDWQDSGLRLRKWLINALHFHVKEQWREVRRHAGESMPDVVEDESTAHLENDLHRAWVDSLVRESFRAAAASCLDSGLSDHWDIFVRHFVNVQAYADLCTDFDISPAQAAVMARTAAIRFRTAVRDSIARDGVETGEIDSEIQSIMGRL